MGQNYDFFFENALVRASQFDGVLLTLCFCWAHLCCCCTVFLISCQYLLHVLLKMTGNSKYDVYENT